MQKISQRRKRKGGTAGIIYVAFKHENDKINETTTTPPKKIYSIGTIKNNHYTEKYNILETVKSISLLPSNEFSAVITEINAELLNYSPDEDEPPIKPYTKDDFFFFTVEKKLTPLKITRRNRTSQKNITKRFRPALHTIVERNSNSSNSK